MSKSEFELLKSEIKDIHKDKLLGVALLYRKKAGSNAGVNIHSQFSDLQNIQDRVYYSQLAEVAIEQYIHIHGETDGLPTYFKYATTVYVRMTLEEAHTWVKEKQDE